MRLFVAVDLDDAARTAIAAEQKRVAAAMDDARSSVTWVKPDRMHLTLVFLGEVSDAHAPAIVDAVSRLVPGVVGVPDIWPSAERFSPCPRLPLATVHV